MNKKVLLFGYSRANFGDDLFVKMLLEKYKNIDFYIKYDKYEFLDILDKYDNLHVLYDCNNIGHTMKIQALNSVNYLKKNQNKPV